MILNEQSFWRLVIASAFGAIAAVALEILHRASKWSLLGGVAAGTAAYVIDWYTSQEQ